MLNLGGTWQTYGSEIMQMAKGSLLELEIESTIFEVSVLSFGVQGEFFLGF